jgi:hypothetical protein
MKETKGYLTQVIGVGTREPVCNFVSFGVFRGQSAGCACHLVQHVQQQILRRLPSAVTVIL